MQAHFRRTGNLDRVAGALNILGYIELEDGEPSAGRAHLEEARAILAEAGDVASLGSVLGKGSRNNK